MRKKSLRTGMLVAASVLALALTGCGTSASPEPTTEPGAAQEEAQYGGVARVASLSEMAGFDPIKLSNVGTGVERAAMVMDTLLARDELTDEVRPQLAESISSEDGKVWVLTLREGVTFTDGEPLNADAVIFNLERHLAEDSGSPAKSLLSAVDTLEATGEYEVTITLSAPSGSFPLALTGSSSASLIGSPKALADPEAFNSHPVGAGPFVFESWTRDDKLTLTRNGDYWAEGLPYLDGIEFVVMADPQTRLDTLSAGGLDLALITSPQWNAVAETPGLNLYMVPTGGQALTFNATREPGSDERVRRAASMVLDGKTTAALIFGGTQFWDGDVSCVPWAPGSPACAPGTTYEQDMETATALVAEYLAEGGSPDVEMVYFQTQGNQAEYYQQQLNAIGLNVSLRPGDTAAITEAQATGDYGLYLGGTASAGFPTVWNRYYSKATNWGKVTYPELDEALLRARDALTLEERNEAWQEVAEIIHEKSISFWTMRYGGAMVSSDRLHLGTPDRPYDGSSMVYLDTAWIEQ